MPVYKPEDVKIELDGVEIVWLEDDEISSEINEHTALCPACLMGIRYTDNMIGQSFQCSCWTWLLITNDGLKRGQ